MTCVRLFTCGLSALTTCCVSPANFRAVSWIETFAGFVLSALSAELAEMQPLKLVAPAKAPLSTCSWRWRLCSNQCPTSIENATSITAELMKMATITRTPPRSLRISWNAFLMPRSGRCRRCCRS